VEPLRFIFWEAIKVLCLAFLGLLAAKAVGSLPAAVRTDTRGHPPGLKMVLYGAVVALIVLGAWRLGYDIAAEVYLSTSQNNLQRSELLKAYLNASEAVELRPGQLRYWRGLALTKLYLRQFSSLVADEPAFRALSPDGLDETDAYRFTLCHFFLGDYDQVIAATQQLVRANPAYAAPYVLQGLSYTAERNYPAAEESFVTVLRQYPVNQAAVEGLAHAYFLEGSRARAQQVLSETEKFPFPPEAQKRFEALKALYGQ
jgi:tetratricopeptide (TPR) repeat protein